MAAAEALGVIYRTMMACYDSRRMRQALEEFRDAGGVVGDEPGDVDGDDPEDIRSESLDRRVGWRCWRVRMPGCGNWWRTRRASWRSWPGGWTRWKGPGDSPTIPQRLMLAVVRIVIMGRIGGLPVAGLECPTPGVVTLEEQPDEEYPFRPAAPLVAEWRRLLAGCDQAVSRVDRAKASVRR